MENKCRNCGRKMEVGEGVFIEDDCCHCEECHSTLYTDEEWKALHEEWNEVDEVNGQYAGGCGDSFYWTEIQEGEEDELLT